VAVQR